MEIWSWLDGAHSELVEAGHTDVANGLYDIAAMALRGDEDEVIALSVQLEGVGAELGMPWLGVFGRHWRMQARGVARNRGKHHLDGVVDAYERAHRPDTVDCPQSVCTVQDLCLEYASADGPGWGAERIAVCEETLARIDPSWSCWECIVREYADALIDEGRADEALRAVDAVPHEREAAGSVASTHFLSGAVGPYLRAGLPDRALHQLDTVTDPDTSEINLDRRRLFRLEAMLDLGRVDELVVGDHIEVGDVEFDRLCRHERNGSPWLANAGRLVAAGRYANTESLGMTARSITERLIGHGTYAVAFESAEIAVRLAVERGALSVARAALDLARTARSGLRRPERVDAELAELERVVAAMPPVTPDVPAVDLVDHIPSVLGTAGLPEGAEPVPTMANAGEHLLDQLDLAVAELPGDPVLFSTWLSFAAPLLGPTIVADAISRQLMQRPDDEELVLTSIGALVQSGAGRDRLEELAGIVEADQPVLAAWALALGANVAGDHRSTLRFCDRVLEADPAALNTRRLARAAAREVGEHELAARYAAELCSLVEPGDDDWALLEHATRAGEWQLVRWAASRLGMTPDSDSDAVAGAGPEVLSAEPIDEVWHPMFVRPRGGAADGSDDQFAVRTGPVTARILSLAYPGMRQRRDDVVLFEPVPLEAVAAEPSPGEEPQPEEDPPPPTFSELDVLQPGRFSAWFLLGARPDDDRMTALFDRIVELDGAVRMLTPPDLMMQLADGRQIAGFEALIGVPQRCEPALLDSLLRAELPTWPGPLVWPMLAQLVGSDDAEAQLDAWNDAQFL